MYIKSFKKFNEAVIIPSKIEDDYIISDIKDIKEYGERNDFLVMSYDEFYESLPSDKARKEAPPRSAPFFALFHPVLNKPIFVISNNNALSILTKGIIDDIIGHERIHQEQVKRRGKITYNLPSPTDRKSYFSNKDEIMAFSWSIANDVINKTNDFEKAKEFLISNKIQGRRYSNPLWNDIKRYCDDTTIKRYKKYIYMYLDKYLNK